MTVNDDSAHSRPLALHWDGSAWSSVKIPNPGGHASLTGIAADKASDVWAVGRYLTSGPTVKTRSFVLHWDGSAWRTVSGPSKTHVVIPGSNAGSARVRASEPTDPAVLSSLKRPSGWPWGRGLARPRKQLGQA
jgi:hypothetical protein